MERLSNDLLERKKSELEENFKIIRDRINEAACKASRDPKDIKLLAATKTVEPEIINHATALGIDLIGENRVQELISKYDYINKEAVDIHFIGHLQTNKVNKIVDKVSMIQSVDSVKIAREIGKIATAINKEQDILLEVNIGKEPNKSGIFPENLLDLAYEISSIKGVRIRGLMTIPPICINNKEEIRSYFARTNKLFVDIKSKKLDNSSIDVLSMGMSNDYYSAILEGASMVRIGSALFGSRK